MVMGGDSCSEGRGFESWHRILDGRFSHIFVVKIESSFVFEMTENKKAGVSPFKKPFLFEWYFWDQSYKDFTA